MARFVLLVLLHCFALPALAQEPWPSRPVKFVAPFPAGGPLDVMARLAAQKLTDLWGRPVVVENVSGGTGSIGANQVARAAPDGYTVLVTVDIPLTMYPAVAKGLPYDPRADFRPVAIVARSVNALFVNAGVNARTVQELVALAKAQPGRLAFSSAGIASPAHFGAELFKSVAGVDMTHVPYKGAAPAMQAAVSGEVQLFFGPIPQGAPHVKSGKVRALGIAGPEASPLLPGVRPLAEQGFAEVQVMTWYPVMVPARTPDAATAALAAGLKRVFQDPDLRARLEAMGTSPDWQEGAEVARTLEGDLRRWTEVARRARMEAPQ